MKAGKNIKFSSYNRHFLSQDFLPQNGFEKTVIEVK